MAENLKVQASGRKRERNLEKNQDLEALEIMTGGYYLF